MMPGETGIGLLRSLRDEHPRASDRHGVGRARPRRRERRAWSSARTATSRSRSTPTRCVIAVDNAIMRATLEDRESCLQGAARVDGARAHDRARRCTRRSRGQRRVAAAVERGDDRHARAGDRGSRHRDRSAHRADEPLRRAARARLWTRRGAVSTDPSREPDARHRKDRSGRRHSVQAGRAEQRPSSTWSRSTPSRDTGFSPSRSIRCCSSRRRSRERITNAGTAPGTRTGSPGTAIPIEGRISAVADVFDAVVSRQGLQGGVPARAGVRRRSRRSRQRSSIPTSSTRSSSTSTTSPTSGLSTPTGSSARRVRITRRDSQARAPAGRATAGRRSEPRDVGSAAREHP